MKFLISKLRFLFSLIAIFILVSLNLSHVFAWSDYFFKKIRLFTQVVDIVKQSYIEDIDEEELVIAAINGMMNHLDPHSRILIENDFDEWTREFEGFSGIGICLETILDTVVVAKIFKNSPAEQSGLKVGDILLAINNEKIIGFTKAQITDRLVGKIGSKLNVLVLDHTRRQRDIQILRQHINFSSIPYAFYLDNGIAYIKIEYFSNTTEFELKKALKFFNSWGMKKLILDLRGNAGGLFNPAIETVDQFLPEGKLIVSTRGRKESMSDDFYSTEKNHAELVPLIVLIDNGTASSAEIVAGALQDWDRALIIGETSFGKGLIQSQFQLDNRMALLLTTARYYTPSGRLIQRPFSHDYENELISSENINRLDSNCTVEKYRTSAGRTVYGGGGIKPDFEVKPDVDCDAELKLFLIENKNYMFIFALDFVKKNRNSYSDFLKFLESFNVNLTIFNSFVAQTRNLNEELQTFPFEKYRSYFSQKIKEEIAFLYWGDEAKYKIFLSTDHQLITAIAMFDKAEKLLNLNHWVANK